MHKIQFLHEGGQCGSEQGEKEDAIITSPPHAKKTKTGTEKEETANVSGSEKFSSKQKARRLLQSLK